MHQNRCKMNAPIQDNAESVFLFMANNRVIEACAIGICKLLESQETIAASFFFVFTWKSVALWFSLFSSVSCSQLDNVAISIDGKVFVCLSRCSMEQSQFQFYVRDFCRFGRNTTRMQYLQNDRTWRHNAVCTAHAHTNANNMMQWEQNEWQL